MALFTSDWVVKDLGKLINYSLYLDVKNFSNQILYCDLFVVSSASCTLSAGELPERVVAV